MDGVQDVSSGVKKTLEGIGEVVLPEVDPAIELERQQSVSMAKRFAARWGLPEDAAVKSVLKTWEQKVRPATPNGVDARGRPTYTEPWSAKPPPPPVLPKTTLPRFTQLDSGRSPPFPVDTYQGETWKPRTFLVGSQEERTGQAYRETEASRAEAVRQLMALNPETQKRTSQGAWLGSQDVPGSVADPRIGAHGGRTLSDQSPVEQSLLNWNPGAAVFLPTRGPRNVAPANYNPAASHVGSLNLGRTLVGAPAALADVIAEKAKGFVDNAQKIGEAQYKPGEEPGLATDLVHAWEGFSGAFNTAAGADLSKLGLKPAKAGFGGSWNPTDWYERWDPQTLNLDSLGEGTAKLPGAVAGMFLAPLQATVATVEGVVAPGSVKEKVKAFVDGAQQFTIGSVSDTVGAITDPIGTYEENPLMSALVLGGLRSKGLAKYDKVTAPITTARARLKGELATTAEELARSLDPKNKNPYELEFKEANALRNASTPTGMTPAQTAKAILDMDVKALENWQTPALAEIFSWKTTLKKKIDWDKNTEATRDALIQTRHGQLVELAKLADPKIIRDAISATTGILTPFTVHETAVIAYQRLKQLLKGVHIDDIGQGYTRQFWRQRPANISQAFQAVEREVAGAYRKEEIELQDIIRQIPVDARPTVREFLTLNHKDIVDGLFQYSSKENLWSLTAKGKNIAAQTMTKHGKTVVRDLQDLNDHGVNLAQKAIHLMDEAVREGLYKNMNDVGKLRKWELPIGASEEALTQGMITHYAKLAYDVGQMKLKRFAAGDIRPGDMDNPTALAFKELKDRPLSMTKEAHTALAAEFPDIKTGYIEVPKDASVTITEALKKQEAASAQIKVTLSRQQQLVQALRGARQGTPSDWVAVDEANIAAIKAFKDVSLWAKTLKLPTIPVLDEVQKTQKRLVKALEVARSGRGTPEAWAKVRALNTQVEAHSANAEKAVRALAQHIYDGPMAAVKWGPLAGRFLQEGHYWEIINHQKLIEDMAGWMPKLLNTWKTGKTAWNPATTMRNVLTNVLVFAPMAGVSMLNPANLKYYAQALRDLLLPLEKKSPQYKQAFVDGALEGSFQRSELGTAALGEALQGAQGNIVAMASALIKSALLIPAAGARLMDKDIGPAKVMRGREARLAAAAELRARVALGPNAAAPAVPGEAILSHASALRTALRDAREQAGYDTSPLWGRTKAIALGAGSGGLLGGVPGALLGAITGHALGKTLTDLPGLFYGATDDLFRLAAYYKNTDTARPIIPFSLDAPMSGKAAGVLSRANFVDYENIAGWVNSIKTPGFSPMRPTSMGVKQGHARQGLFYLVGSPFMSFNAQATPLMKNWVLHNPLQAGLYSELHRYITGLNQAAMGMDKDELDAMTEALPLWQRTTSMPGVNIHKSLAKDEKGNPNFVGLGFMTPFGTFAPKFDPYTGGFEQAQDVARQLLGPGGAPVFGAVTDLFLNKRDPFTGQPVTEGVPFIEKMIKTLGPGLTPSPTDFMEQLGIGSGDPADRIEGGSNYEKIFGLGKAKPYGPTPEFWQKLVSGLGGIDIDTHSPKELAYKNFLGFQYRVKELSDAFEEREQLRLQSSNTPMDSSRAEKRIHRAVAEGVGAEAAGIAREFLATVTRLPYFKDKRLITAELTHLLKIPSSRKLGEALIKYIGRQRSRFGKAKLQSFE